MNTPTWNKSYGKQGEQLLKSGCHSASLDETNKYRGQCGQPSGGHKVMQQATLINLNLNDMNHNRRTALERSVINNRGLKLVLRAQPRPP